MAAIICDRRAPGKIEGMTLRMVVRPTMVYGLETTEKGAGDIVALKKEDGEEDGETRYVFGHGEG